MKDAAKEYEDKTDLKWTKVVNGEKKNMYCMRTVRRRHATEYL